MGLVEVICAERKSAVLKPASMACLGRRVTVNLTAGCAHGCVYCYARGYGSYPGEGKVRLYANTPAKLREELPRKRKRPEAVHFSPSSDLFQPVPEVLETAYRVLEMLFEQRIGVSFLTKGTIPRRHMELLRENAPLVRAQFGLLSLDDSIRRTFEPHAAPVRVRLDQARELVGAGIATEARLDPILPGVTDGEDTFDAVCGALAEIGVTRIAASVLFLRPAIAAAIRRRVRKPCLLERLLGEFTSRLRPAISGSRTAVRVLPLPARLAIYDRLIAAATRHGVDARVCGCKNPDCGAGFCGVGGEWPRAGERPGQLTADSSHPGGRWPKSLLENGRAEA